MIYDLVRLDLATSFYILLIVTIYYIQYTYNYNAIYFYNWIIKYLVKHMATEPLGQQHNIIQNKPGSG